MRRAPQVLHINTDAAGNVHKPDQIFGGKKVKFFFGEIVSQNINEKRSMAEQFGHRHGNQTMERPKWNPCQLLGCQVLRLHKRGARVMVYIASLLREKFKGASFLVGTGHQFVLVLTPRLN
jgi:hypothetical protein